MSSSWADVDDHGEPERRQEWRLAPSDPPREVATEIDVPIAAVAQLEETSRQ